MKQKKTVEICALAVFMLFLQEWQIAGITVRTLLVYFYMVIAGVFWIKNPQKRKWTALDSLLGLFLIWNLLQFAAGLLAGKGCEEKNILLIALLLLFFIVSSNGAETVLKENVLKDGILVFAVPVFLELFWHFFINGKFTFNLKPLLGNQEALASYLLLVCAIATTEYCRETEQIKRRFYLILSLAGYFLLFLNRNIMGIVIMGLVFPVFVLLREPDRQFVRQISGMAFLYFFLLSYMPLLEMLGMAGGTDGFYNMESGVYLELVLAIFAAAFFSWWDKLPEENVRPLYTFKKRAGEFLVCAVLFLFLLLVMGKHLEGMEAKMGMEVLKHFASEMRIYCEQHKGMFLDVLEQYGVPGLIWLSGAMLAAADRLRAQVRRRKVTSEGTILCILFFIQSLFISFQPVTAPVYVLLIAEGLYGSAGREVNSGEVDIYEEE